MKIFEDIESERDRIQACIKKFGWTSDHNLDWFSAALEKVNGKPAFVELNNGSGFLVHIYPGEVHVWSDPLCDKKNIVESTADFIKFICKEGLEKIWFKYVSDTLHLELSKISDFKTGKIDYSLYWPVLNMDLFDSALPGGNFKEIRNAKNKFFRNHSLKVYDFNPDLKEALHKVIDGWKTVATSKEEESYVYDFWYHRVIDAGFKGFKTARVLEVDGKIVGFNAGYEVVNNPGRFAGTIGIQDYSVPEMGLMLWLEDLEWIKNNGYKEMDMQGDEMNSKIKIKLRFGAQIERKTDTFSIAKI